VLGHVGQAEGLGVADQLPKHSVAARRRADRAAGLLVEADCQEALELALVLVENSQSRVARRREVARGLQHLLEDGLEVELRNEPAPNGQQARELLLAEKSAIVGHDGQGYLSVVRTETSRGIWRKSAPRRGSSLQTMQDDRGTILIGFDGSEEAEDAIRCAGQLFAPRRAIVAHVWDSLAELLLHSDIDHLAGSMREAAEELDAEDAREAEAIAARGAEIAEEAGFERIPVAARGRPKAWPTLLELAEQHDAAAIVVGSRGLGGVKSALLGSVSSGLLDHAHRPVLIVPPLDELRAPGPVVIGYDGSEHADSAVKAAGRLLKVREVILQTVWVSYQALAPAGLAGAPVVVVSKASEEVDRGVREAAQRTAKRGARLAAAHGLEVQAEAVHSDGNAWRTLLDTAHAHRAAAIVVGSRGKSAVGAALVGSVSRALVHHAPAPVLVVRPPK
jgi:nucleotide-binding universal stress UspA family protein